MKSKEILNIWTRTSWQSKYTIQYAITWNVSHIKSMWPLLMEAADTRIYRKYTACCAKGASCLNYQLQRSRTVYVQIRMHCGNTHYISAQTHHESWESGGHFDSELTINGWCSNRLRMLFTSWNHKFTIHTGPSRKTWRLLLSDGWWFQQMLGEVLRGGKKLIFLVLIQLLCLRTWLQFFKKLPPTPSSPRQFDLWQRVHEIRLHTESSLVVFTPS